MGWGSIRRGWWSGDDSEKDDRENFTGEHARGECGVLNGDSGIFLRDTLGDTMVACFRL